MICTTVKYSEISFPLSLSLCLSLSIYFPLSPLPLRPQVAIAQFSDDARTEFKLNTYNNKENLLEAIQRIAYKGGNTKTGKSLVQSVAKLVGEPRSSEDCSLFRTTPSPTVF